MAFSHQINWERLIIGMIIGGTIGLAIISIFVFGGDNPKPEWGANWRMRPLILTPLVAAMGGAAFYLTPFLNPKSNFIRVVLYAFSVLAFIVALWIGIVLGLDGTMWD